MKKLLISKSENIVANLKTNKEKSFTKLETAKIAKAISDSLVKKKREIIRNQKKSLIEASKIILSG